jgi:hypothetical protein
MSDGEHIRVSDETSQIMESISNALDPTSGTNDPIRRYVPKGWVVLTDEAGEEISINITQIASIRPQSQQGPMLAAYGGVRRHPS